MEIDTLVSNIVKIEKSIEEIKRCKNMQNEKKKLFLSSEHSKPLWICDLNIYMKYIAMYEVI